MLKLYRGRDQVVVIEWADGRRAIIEVGEFRRNASVELKFHVPEDVLVLRGELDRS